jgi:predicted Zn-dependent peptidase
MSARAYDVRKSVLDNGIRVVTETVPHTRTVSVGVLVGAGPRDEQVGHAGLAHLCEHMAFQGTSGRSSTDIARLMDSVGGGIGAFTSHDYTCYSATVPEECCPFAVDLLGDILLNSTFVDERLRTERTAIACEIEADADRPHARSHIAMRDIAWPEHALGRSVTGTVDSVRRLTRDDAIYFVHRHYVPARVIVVASGCLDHEDLVAGVRDGFWRLLGSDSEALVAPPCAGGGLRIATAPVSLAYFSLGLQAPAYADADRYATHVLARLLGGGISSRLYRRIREERGLAYDIGSEYVAYADAGLLVLEGSAPAEVVTSVLALIGDEVARIAGGAGIDDDDLQRVQAQIRGQIAMSGDDMHTRMSRLALQMLYFGRDVPEAEVIARVQHVDADAVARVAARCVADPKIQSLAIVGPAALADIVGGGDQAVFPPLGTLGMSSGIQ